jgi:hypothetical protein
MGISAYAVIQLILHLEAGKGMLKGTGLAPALNDVAL